MAVYDILQRQNVVNSRDRRHFNVAYRDNNRRFNAAYYFLSAIEANSCIESRNSFVIEIILS